jgi:hypothetical protein
MKLTTNAMSSIQQQAGLLQHAPRAMRNVLALLSMWLLAASAAHALDFNGWWWNPATSGQGVNVGQQGDIMFMAWFTYDETGKGAWLIMSGQLSANNDFSGSLLRTKGPALGTPFNPALVTGSAVGTGTLSFSDLHHASLAWTFDGKSGTLPLVRESYGAGPVDPSGNYLQSNGVAGKTVGNAQCAYTGSTAAVPTGFNIVKSGTTLTISLPNTPTATFSGTFQQSGEWLYVPTGNYTSADSYGSGTFTASVLTIDRSTFVRMDLSPTAHPGCVLTRSLSGVR